MRYTYPKSFWLIADQIGHARSVLNQSMLQHNPEFDRGEKSDHVDRVGIAGELIVADYLTRKKVDFTMANLLDLYPSKNPDFIIKGKNIDVKSTYHFKGAHVLVNERAHRKGLGKIEMYWIVYILDKENADFYFVDYEDVSKWECKFMKYTNAFCIKPENLKK